MSVVYVIANADCGPLINAKKFHLTHKQFGPGPASTVYNAIMQAFLDCGQEKVLILIPQGDSNNFITCM